MDNTLRVVELDALSYGRDVGNGLRFSVTEFARGTSGTDLADEAALPLFGAGADVFTYRRKVDPATSTTPGTVVGNAFFIDGDGVKPLPRANPRPGVGLDDRNPPVPGVPDDGDNLDAMNLDTRPGETDGPIFFSLDGAYSDPSEGLPVNSGTAARNCFSAADVLVQSSRGTPPAVYALAEQLGLTGDDRMDWRAPHDDLDALALWDDGDMVFEPDVDQILFSIRNESHIMGQLDSRTLQPIEEGDVLTIPDPGGTTPAIVVHAEAMGLFSRRIDCARTSCGEVDALDLFNFLPGDFDLDGDLDAVDIDSLVMTIASGEQVLLFDITGDGVVDHDDLDEWLMAGGAFNLPSGNPYLYGDANLDGNVDVQDFNQWNLFKFTSTGKWTQADFDASGNTDVGDFNQWNANKFTSADTFSAVPEPTVTTWLGLILVVSCAYGVAARRKSKRL